MFEKYDEEKLDTGDHGAGDMIPADPVIIRDDQSSDSSDADDNGEFVM